MPPYAQQPTSQPATISLALALDHLLEHTARRVRDGVRSRHTLAMQTSHVRWMTEQLAWPETGLPDGRLGDVPIAALSPPVLVALIEHWRTEGGLEGRGLAVQTVAKRASTLRRALRLAVGRGELERPPQFPELALPPIRPRARILKDAAELRLVMEALPLRRAERVALQIWSCQRNGDTERMCWSDVDLQSATKTMLIRSTKTRKPWGFRVRCPSPLVSVLSARRQRLVSTGRAPVASDPLVEPWPGISKTLPLVCVRLGLPPLSAMDLRHTGFSWMIRRRGITEAARQWGGWSDFQMLCLYYAHALPAGLEECTAELESMAANDNGRADDDGGGPPPAPAAARASNDNGRGR